jgi:hypothetical protein
MAVIDLDRPRRKTPAEPRDGEGPAKEPRRHVYVTPSGRVVIGDEVKDGEEHMLSEVHPAVFA